MNVVYWHSRWWEPGGWRPRAGGDRDPVYHVDGPDCVCPHCLGHDRGAERAGWARARGGRDACEMMARYP